AKLRQKASPCSIGLKATISAIRSIGPGRSAGVLAWNSIGRNFHEKALGQPETFREARGGRCDRTRVYRLQRLVCVSLFFGLGRCEIPDGKSATYAGHV